MELTTSLTENPRLGVLAAFLDSMECQADVLGALTTLGVEGPLDRPAEFSALQCARSVEAKTGVWGLAVRLTDVSRGARKSEVFHQLLAQLVKLYERAISKQAPRGTRVQLFVRIVLDADIQLSDGSYGCIIESEAKWVESGSVLDTSRPSGASAR